MLKLYDCMLTLSVDQSGNPIFTMPKAGITENELILLRHIHGHDRVQNIVPAGEIDRDKTEDLCMLARAYGPLEEGTIDRRGVMLVEKVFSTALPEFDTWIVTRLEEEEQARRAKDEARRELPAQVTALAHAAAAAQVAKAAKAQPKKEAEPAPAAMADLD